MEPTRNLLIIHTPGRQARSDWETVAKKIRADAPDIEVRIGDGSRPDRELSLWQNSRPSLFFSAAPLDKIFPSGGRFYCGRPIPKIAEIRQMERCGIPTPRNVPLIPGLLLSKEVWGDYVIVKPMKGSHGIGVTLARTHDVSTQYIKLTRNDPRRARMMVQEFIDHTDSSGRLVDYRALMMFGEPLYLHRRKTAKKRGSLEEMAAELSTKIASNAPGIRRRRELVYDKDVLDLAKRATEAFPHIPVLGVDIIQSRETKRYYVLEVNAWGTVWHFSSDIGIRQIDEKTRAASYKQFDALATAARLLIERTRAEAR